LNDTNPAALVPFVTGGAFILAFIFGAVGNKTRFCTMGAVSDWVNMGETSRLRMWLLAIAVAILGAAALQLGGLVDYSKSIYTSANFTWLSFLTCWNNVSITPGSRISTPLTRCSTSPARRPIFSYRLPGLIDSIRHPSNFPSV